MDRSLKFFKQTEIYIFFMALLYGYIQWNIYFAQVILKINATIYLDISPPDIVRDTLIGFISGALYEESMYRWIPFLAFNMVYLCLSYFLKRQYKYAEIIGLCIVTIFMSYSFGVVHGEYVNLLMQGILGLILSFLYIRTFIKTKMIPIIGQLQIIPLLVTFLFHMFSNQIIFLMIIQ